MFQVPFAPNNSFVGRKSILAEIEAAIRKNQEADRCVPTVLKGLGGMGKSQLMLTYCYAHRKEYKYIFWINAEGSLESLEEFQILAEKLNIKAYNDEDLPGRIREWFQSREERWLLLLDNVDAFEDVYDFIPHFGGDVIVTTRNHVSDANGYVILVDKMNKEDALLLLLGSKIYDTPPADAIEIVEELDYMPLAVGIVRGYIDRTGMPFKAYLEIYRKKRAFLFQNEQDVNRSQYAYNVATVWELSFKKLREQNKLAGLIIGACAFLHPDAIPVSLFERQSTALHLDANVDAIRAAVGILVQFSFVRRTVTYDVDIGGDNDYDPARDLLAIHRLVQEVIRESSIMKDVGQKAWGELLVAAMNNEVTSAEYHVPRVRKINDMYIPHIRNVITQVDWRQMDSETQTLLVSLLHTTAEYLHEGGTFQSGVEFALVSISISKSFGDVDHPDLALSLGRLASLYIRQGKYDEAGPLCQRALAINEKVLDPNHPETLKSLDNLAELYYLQGKYDEAKPIYQRSLAIKEKALGLDHPDTAESLNDLALLYHTLGEDDKAMSLYQRSLSIREKVLGSNHPDTAESLNNLAGLYDNQGKYDEAKEMFQRSLAIKEKVLGPDHPDTAISLHNLAGLYYDQGKYDEAEPLFRRALAIREKMLGPDHPETSVTLSNLALLYDNQGKYDEAEEMCQRSLAIKEKVLGSDHPGTATSLHNLAGLYYDQSKYDEAEPLYQRSLSIREKVLGPNHPDTAISLHNLAGLYYNQSRYDEAEPLFRRALAIFEKALGPDHPYTTSTIGFLAVLHPSTRETEAKEIVSRPNHLVLVNFKKIWGKITRTRRHARMLNKE